MNDMTSIYNSYVFMNLNETDTLEQIRKQYRDLMMLWHPDKHANNIKEQHKYETLTKQLNSEYDNVVNYINSFGYPKFANDAAIQKIDIRSLGIPEYEYEYWRKLDYDIGFGLSNNINAAAYNALSGTLNVMNSAFKIIDKWTEKLQREAINALATAIDNIAESKNSIMFDSVSYSRKVNIASIDYIDEGIFSIFSNKVKYTENAKRYLDFLNGNLFCGISDWKFMSAEALYKLMCFARSQGYAVGDDKLFIGRDHYEKKYLDSCCINSTIVCLRHVEHVPLNGSSFIDFLNSIGFYGTDNDYIYYKHDDFICKYQLSTCESSAYKQGDITPCLWPISKGREGEVTTFISLDIITSADELAKAVTKNKAIDELAAKILFYTAIIWAPLLFIAIIAAVLVIIVLGFDAISKR